MKRVLVFFGIFFQLLIIGKYAEAKTLTIYGDTSDAVVVTKPSSTWSESYNTTTAHLLLKDWEYAESVVRSHNNLEYVINRSFFNFDTSQIPDDAVITGVDFNVFVYQTHNDGNQEYAYVGVYQGAQDIVNDISLSDITSCGSPLENPVAGAGTVRISDVTPGVHKNFELNQEGLSWISKTGYSSLCLRTGHDVENRAISGGPYTYSGIRMHSANYMGTSSDPYLVITYEIPEPEDEYPLYTQVESPYPSLLETADWEDDTFAYGSEEWCGDTIGGCGCAITSGVMAGRSAGITTDVSGKDVNPKNINEYLTRVGGYTSDGSVYWLAMQAYLGELSGDKLASRFKYVGKYEGATAMSSADEYLESEGEYAVLAFKNSLGHFVWLPEKTDVGYAVRDPLWYLTTTANDTNGTSVKNYNNSFDSIRVFEVLDEPELYSGYGVEAYIKGAAELLYKDVTGNAVGYTENGIVVSVDRSSYGNAEVIGQNGTPSSQTGGKHLLVYKTGNEFTIDVVGTGSGEFEMEFFTISETGEITTFSFSGETYPGVTSTFSFNLETGEVKEEPISYEQFLKILGLQMEGYTKQQRAFFMKWAEKMYANMEEKTVSQALQGIEVYKKLLLAKKIESPLLSNVLGTLTEQLKKK